MYICMCVAICERKPLNGSCVVWMLRPLSEACQDALSYVRYPEFTRERESVCVRMYVCSSL